MKRSCSPEVIQVVLWIHLSKVEKALENLQEKFLKLICFTLTNAQVLKQYGNKKIPMQHTDQNKRIYSDGKCMIQIINVENFSQKNIQ